MLVFISYAWESDAFKQQIWELANWLSVTGKGEVKVELDQLYQNRPPIEGWPVWMLRTIEKADIVLIICTKKYKEHFEKRDLATGRGALFEGAIITQDLYNNQLKNDKFFPILADHGTIEDVPKILQAYFNNHSVSNKENILKLIRNENPIFSNIIENGGGDDLHEQPSIIEEIIVDDIKQVTTENIAKMESPIYQIVHAYLALSDIEKIKIIRNLGLYKDDYDKILQSERDRSFFKEASENNLLGEVWEQVNRINPFTDSQNQFKKN